MKLVKDEENMKRYQTTIMKQAGNESLLVETVDSYLWLVHHKKEQFLKSLSWKQCREKVKHWGNQ